MGKRGDRGLEGRPIVTQVSIDDKPPARWCIVLTIWPFGMQLSVPIAAPFEQLTILSLSAPTPPPHSPCQSQDWLCQPVLPL